MSSYSVLKIENMITGSASENTGTLVVPGAGKS